MVRQSSRHGPAMRSYYLPAAAPAPHGGPRLLMILGTILLLLSGGVVAYPRFAEWRHYAQQPARPADILPVAVAAAPAEAGRGAVAAPGPAASAPTSDLRRRPQRITIPRIKVDTSVMEVVVEDGTYQVPSFDVGHHADSVNPGESGNSVFNGHLTTIDAGRVFAELNQLAVGDTVQLYTPIDRSEWVIEQVRVVPASDNSFIQPTTDSRITLYTCAGTFDPRTRDYTHRLVVVGRLAQVVPNSV